MANVISYFCLCKKLLCQFYWVCCRTDAFGDAMTRLQKWYLVNIKSAALKSVRALDFDWTPAPDYFNFICPQRTIGFAARQRCKQDISKQNIGASTLNNSTSADNTVVSRIVLTCNELYIAVSAVT